MLLLQLGSNPNVCSRVGGHHTFVCLQRSSQRLELRWVAFFLCQVSASSALFLRRVQTSGPTYIHQPRLRCLCPCLLPQRLDSTPLHWAANEGQLAATRWLTLYGADLNAQEAKGGEMFAALRVRC